MSFFAEEEKALFTKASSWGFEQPGLVEGVPVNERTVEQGDL